VPAMYMNIQQSLGNKIMNQPTAICRHKPQ